MRTESHFQSKKQGNESQGIGEKKCSFFRLRPTLEERMSIKEIDFKLRPKRKIKEALWQKTRGKGYGQGIWQQLKGQRKALWLAKHLQPYYWRIYTCDFIHCVFVFSLGYKIWFPNPVPGDFEKGIHMTLPCSFFVGPRNFKFCKLKSGTQARCGSVHL